MVPVQSLATSVADLVGAAISAVLPDLSPVDPQVRRSDRADFQANAIMSLARSRGTNPRELASRVAGELTEGELLTSWEVAGPGFLNLTVSDAAIMSRLAARSGDPRLGVAPAAVSGLTVVDYSQPNIAKEMHVGHLRSTVIGDALVRLLEFSGETVVRRNHLGDWGTQFGMLIQFLNEHADEVEDDSDSGPSMSRLTRLYRLARVRFDADNAFVERARQRVVDLQAGDAATVAVWQQLVDESKRYFEAVYARLGVLLEDADALGESYYNPMLADVCAQLEASGVAVRSQGALCVFFEGINGPDGQPVPLIVQKSDGGYGYAATDLAAIRDRVDTLKASQLLYVVDSRQALHFQMVFDTARRAGWLPEGVSAGHLPFGTVLGPDGRPFKTRAGDNVQLMDLLDAAVDRAGEVVAGKNPQLGAEELAERATQVGIGAVKYADLSTSRTRDYIFDVDRMVSLTGNTATYLQYAYARTQSILRNAPDGVAPGAEPQLALEPAERALGLLLDEFGATVHDVLETFEPHRLAAYLHDLAVAFTSFYELCPVLKQPTTPPLMRNRLLLCQLTGQTLSLGMRLLGIAAPERL